MEADRTLVCGNANLLTAYFRAGTYPASEIKKLLIDLRLLIAIVT